MRYFILEQDKGYVDIPKPLNWFQHLTAFNTRKPDVQNLQNREIIRMESGENTVYVDALFFPFFIITDKVRACIALYEPNMQFQEIILLNSNKKIKQNYFIPSVAEVDCLTSNCEYTFGHMDLKYIEIDKRKVKDKAIFRIKGGEKYYIVARLDVVESLLRRGVKGFMVREIDVKNEEDVKESVSRSILSKKEREEWRKQEMMRRYIW